MTFFLEAPIFFLEGARFSADISRIGRDLRPQPMRASAREKAPRTDSHGWL